MFTFTLIVALCSAFQNSVRVRVKRGGGYGQRNNLRIPLGLTDLNIAGPQRLSFSLFRNPSIRGPRDISIGNNRDFRFSFLRDLSIGGCRDCSIGGPRDLSFSVLRNLSIGGPSKIKIGGHRSHGYHWWVMTEPLSKVWSLACQHRKQHSAIKLISLTEINCHLTETLYFQVIKTVFQADSCGGYRPKGANIFIKSFGLPC